MPTLVSVWRTERTSTKARNQGTQCRRAAPDRPKGGRFLTG